MIRCLLFLSLFIATSCFGQLTATGTYQGKNLYVYNPNAENGFAYCTDSVTVNGCRYDNGKMKRGAFEIQLDSLNLNLGDSLKVVLYHKLGCKPKLINNGGYRFLPSIDQVMADTSAISWEFENADSGRFVLETYRWNKWIQVGEVAQSHQTTLYNYSIQDILHSGSNELRVCFVTNKDGHKTTSRAVLVRSNKSPVSFKMDHKSKQITFSRKTSFELYNERGDNIRQGTTEILDLKDVSSGIYYLNFDNENRKVKVK